MEDTIHEQYLCSTYTLTHTVSYGNWMKQDRCWRIFYTEGRVTCDQWLKEMMGSIPQCQGQGMSGRTPECSEFTAAYSGKMVLELPSESVVQFFLFASLRTRKRIQNFLVTIFRERKVGGGERSWKFLLEEKGLIWNEEHSLTNEKRDQDQNTEKSFAFRTEKEEKPRREAQRYPKWVQSF